MSKVKLIYTVKWMFKIEPILGMIIIKINYSVVFILVSSLFFTGCESGKMKNGGIDEWRKLAGVSGKLRFIEETNDTIRFEAYAPQNQTGSLYKWRKFEVEKRELTEDERSRIRTPGLSSEGMGSGDKTTGMGKGSGEQE